MAPARLTAPLNQSYGFSLGNHTLVLGRPLGIIASVSYNRRAREYTDGTVARYQLTSTGASQLTNDFLFTDRRGTDEVLWGTLVNANYKPHPEHELGFVYMRNRSAESSARYQFGSFPRDLSSNAVYETRTLQYVSRSLNSYQAQGKHAPFGGKGLKVEWGGTLSTTLQDEPDLRFFTNDYAPLERGGETILVYEISPALYPVPTRYFRTMEEDSRSGSLGATLPFTQWSGLSAQLKFGGDLEVKTRSFRERRFEFRQDKGRYDGNEHTFFEEHVGISEEASTDRFFRFGNYILDATQPSSNYDGEMTIYAGYLMLDLPVSRRLRAIGGLRVETTDMRAASLDSSLQVGHIDTQDLLPSVNLVYQLSRNMNIRGAHGRTLARPTFREIAPYASFDFVGDYIYIGNANLERSLIDNYDLRWEWFARPGEIIAVSGFYKWFRKPIERALRPGRGRVEPEHPVQERGQCPGIRRGSGGAQAPRCINPSVTTRAGGWQPLSGAIHRADSARRTGAHSSPAARRPVHPPASGTIPLRDQPRSDVRQPQLRLDGERLLQRLRPAPGSSGRGRHPKHLRAAPPRRRLHLPAGTVLPRGPQGVREEPLRRSNHIFAKLPGNQVRGGRVWVWSVLLTWRESGRPMNALETVRALRSGTATPGALQPPGHSWSASNKPPCKPTNNIPMYDTIRTALAFALLIPATALAQGEITVTDADIVGDVEWTADNTYILEGFVFVEDGESLTIEAGTVIKGSPGQGENASALIVARGGMIFAEGTSTSPIVFTAQADDVSDPDDLPIDARGLWGGVLILGKASLNSTPGETAIEGIPTAETRAIYGCLPGACDDEDNSGVFRYASIRYGGSDIGAGNEINGLSMGGVGSGTTIEFVEVFNNKDDGFEWFGGTVNTRYLVSAFNGDDAFDYDEGFRGKGQFWFSIQDDEVGNSAGEHDGGTDPEDGQPYAIPIISNATYLGSGATSTNVKNTPALNLRDNAGGIYHNSIIHDFVGYALTIEDLEGNDALSSGADSRARLEAGDLDFHNNIFGTFGSGIVEQSWLLPYLVRAQQQGNRIVDPMLRSVSREPDGELDPRPADGSPALSGAVDIGDDWFASTDYVGAFGATNWATWTFLAEVGVLTMDTTTVSVEPSLDGELPSVLALGQNYPNPFNPSTTIEFQLDEMQEVTLAVYDLMGREVGVLAEGTHPAGSYRIAFDGSRLASGTYVYVLRSEQQILMRKMALVK